MTDRNIQSWTESYFETIFARLSARDQAPPERHAWLDMIIGVTGKAGFSLDLDKDGLARAFEAHKDAVKSTIPAEQLLIYQVKDGWEPLCEFLDLPIPEKPFPRSNDREEFLSRFRKS